MKILNKSHYKLKIQFIFFLKIFREISPMNREAPMISYNKALDSVAILGNEFEQTIKAFENV